MSFTSHTIYESDKTIGITIQPLPNITRQELIQLIDELGEILNEYDVTID